MNLSQLRQRFNMPDLVTFEEDRGLIRVQIHTPAAKATIYMQGAHLTAFQPAGQGPVIFLSRQSDFAPGKPLRGGIPIVFPWFATDSKKDRVDGHPGPSHGFARIQEWELSAIERRGGDLVLRFALGPTAMSRSMGSDRFALTLEFTIGSSLALRMTVENQADAPLTFEEAFHTYYFVTDVHEVTLTGLEPTPYIDKTDNFKLKPAANEPFRPMQFTDRIYNGTSAACVLHDGATHRRIMVSKTGSNTTVVFNPWKEMPDLGAWEWHEFLAVEAANVGVDSMTLAAGASHTMGLHVTVENG